MIISPRRLSADKMPDVAGAVEAQLVKDFTFNRDLVVYVRADEKAGKNTSWLTVACTKGGI